MNGYERGSPGQPVYAIPPWCYLILARRNGATPHRERREDRQRDRDRVRTEDVGTVGKKETVPTGTDAHRNTATRTAVCSVCNW